MAANREYPDNVLLNDEDSVLAEALRVAREASVVLNTNHNLAVRAYNVEAKLVNDKIDSILSERGMDPKNFTIKRNTDGNLMIVQMDCGREPPGSLRAQMR